MDPPQWYVQELSVDTNTDPGNYIGMLQIFSGYREGDSGIEALVRLYNKFNHPDIAKSYMNELNAQLDSTCSESLEALEPGATNSYVHFAIHFFNCRLSPTPPNTPECLEVFS